MKKIFLTFLLMSFNLQQTFATNINAYACPTKPYLIASKFSQFINRISGSIFLMSTLLEKNINKVVKKNLNGDITTNLKIFSLQDILEGKFKSLEIKIKNGSYNDYFYFSELKAKTLCEFNHILVHKQTSIVQFMENFLMDYDLIITNDDLNKILNSKKVIKQISNMQINFKNLGTLKIETPKLEIENNKIKYSFLLNSDLFFLKTQQLITGFADLAIKDNKIIFLPAYENSSQKADSMIKLLNYFPLFSKKFDIIKEVPSILQFNSIKIEQNKIKLNATFVVPKSI